MPGSRCWKHVNIQAGNSHGIHSWFVDFSKFYRHQFKESMSRYLLRTGDGECLRGVDATQGLRQRCVAAASSVKSLLLYEALDHCNTLYTSCSVLFGEADDVLNHFLQFAAVKVELL